MGDGLSKLFGGEPTPPASADAGSASCQPAYLGDGRSEEAEEDFDDEGEEVGEDEFEEQQEQGQEAARERDAARYQEAVRHAVAKQRMRHGAGRVLRAKYASQMATSLLYTTTLTREESEPSFGLAIDQNMRVLSADEGSPCWRAGLRQFDRITKVDAQEATPDEIATLVSGKLEVQLNIERPNLEQLMNVAVELEAFEWIAWIQARRNDR